MKKNNINFNPFLLFICLIVLFSFNVHKRKKIKLGQDIKDIKNYKKTDTILFGAHRNFSNMHLIEINEVDYKFTLDNKNQINYISTNDTDFIIQKNIRINDPLRTLKNKEFFHRRGWGYYTKVSSNQYALFSNCKSPNDDTEIKAFFQFKFGRKKCKNSTKIDFSGKRLIKLKEENNK